MNTNTMELNLDEMAMVNGGEAGDVMDHVGGAIGLACGIFIVCCIAAEVPLYANLILPLFIIAFICMMIIPGHIINRKAKLQR